MKYVLTTNVKQDEILRKSFNELTEKTFGFNFIDWYQNGYWQEQYIPYSLLDEDKVIANVSVNLMDFEIDGVKKRYIQLGTVMTDEAYRKQGLGRYLIEAVLKEYENKADGIYLFANDSVLNYYPKFGFTHIKEHQYSKKLDLSNTVKSVKLVDMKDSAVKDRVFDAVRNMTANNNLHMDNLGLYSFWLTGWLSDKIYYCEKEDAYVIAIIEENKLVLYQIISKHVVDMDVIIASFGSEAKEVVLRFTPLDTTGYEVKEFEEEGSTLFVRGEDLRSIEKKKLRFPLYSHA